MKLKYYGTAAAEGVPALFCECDTCSRAREKGGRNVRTRSQATIDDILLIDFPADTYLHVLMYGLPLHKISTCLITHSHSDHLCPTEFGMRIEGYSHLKDNKPFAVYGTQAVLDVIRSDREMCNHIDEMLEAGELELHPVIPFVPFWAEGYKITALNADHKIRLSDEQSVIYMIEKDGKSVLYANDTGLLPRETADYLAKLDICFDLISFDCTNVLLEWDNRQHMGLTGNCILREQLTDMGRMDGHTKCVVNHFSHNGLAGYDELVPIAGEKGFEVSYDTMEVEI